MQTQYVALLYQTPTIRNFKSFRTQLYLLLQVVHETQTFKACKTKPVSYQWAPISNSMLLNLTNNLNANTSFKSP